MGKRLLGENLHKVFDIDQRVKNTWAIDLST